MQVEQSQQTLWVFSFGGGVQSTAVLVLQATGRLQEPYDAFIFANVGEDSENPDTLRYIEEIAKPYAAAHGIKFVEVRRTLGGEPITLLKYASEKRRGLVLPLRMGGNGKPAPRRCTEDFKIRVLDKWCTEIGARRVVVGLGISLDEFHRARDEQWHNQYAGRKLAFAKRREYPLLDLRLSRADCLRIVTDAGLPQPPKSACYFCPFHKSAHWIELKRNHPELFQRAVELEQQIHQQNGVSGEDAVYFHRSLRPLDEAVSDQLPLWSDGPDDNCESGYCMV